MLTGHIRGSHQKGRARTTVEYAWPFIIWDPLHFSDPSVRWSAWIRHRNHGQSLSNEQLLEPPSGPLC